MKKIVLTFKNLVARAGMFAMLCSGFANRAEAKAPDTGKPNVLWIYLEDVTALMRLYGTEGVVTPLAESLAENGVLFNNAFVPAPVCSPCRSSIITGSMGTTLGLNQHRSSRTKETAIYLPEGYKTVPELFKDAGYSTYNEGKDDYNFWYDRNKLYDETDGKPARKNWRRLQGGRRIDWAKVPKDKPFFAQVQLRGGKNKKKVANPYPLDSVKIPPYYPDHPEFRKLYARHIDCVKITDDEAADLLDRMKKNGHLDNTIVFFFSDHGMKAPRHKQYPTEQGLEIPFIVRWFGADNNIVKAGKVRNDLVNAIDLGPTSLALCGLDIPNYMEGKNIFGKGYKRDYVIGFRDRCDNTIDHIRTVRTKRYRYIKNYFPERPMSQLSYRSGHPEMVTFQKLYDEGKLNAVQAAYFERKPHEEFYDLKNDPHCIKNLAEDAKYAKELYRHRQILNDWIKETDDKGQYPETEAELRRVYKERKAKCVNPEYDIFRDARL
ncbi:hypothetical protein FUAX_37210 [Fulvitalea axinellae]|uniref:Sulfatase N-terminal domain-containing protein n=1 Tax=Fulvitalea axinellae TaxID=1182444 RepID=A0AAU9CXP7_9BACT|nr:hypothetical protein FUAX_37210 [Fulvitalea axinellae]